MAKPKFLSLDGVRTLVTYIKEKLATKVDKEPGKSLSDNNYSDADVAKLDSIESGAQENLIESIQVNGNAQAIDQKNVNIAIPLVDATLTNTGQSADAKATGDAIATLDQSLSQTATAIRQEFDDADNQLAQEMTQALEELSGTIPTKTSELTNDSDYTTKGYVDNEIAGVESAIPTKTSQLQNDSDYTTKQYVAGELDTLEASIPTKVSQLQNDSSYATTTQLTNGLATKEDTLQYGTATAEDVGKAMIPKTVESGKVTSWEFGEAGKVDDVQINGTSILNNKTANIPLATDSTLGVVKSNASGGVVVGNTGLLQTDAATVNHTKLASDGHKPITPSTEHSAAFYGLAKASGDTTQSQSSNAVGQYTDEAKSAIKNMLGFATSSDISSAIDNLVNTRYHVCEPGEYNSTTYIPTLTGELGVIYLVPKPIGDTGIDNDSITGTAQIGTATIATTNNIFYEYIYTGTKFEQIGDTKVDLTGYLTDADIATDASVTTMLNQVFS